MSARQQAPLPASPWWRRLWHGDAHQRDATHALYSAIVKQARRPVFFTRLGVPDTPEGRFEMIALHAALVMRRLKVEGEAGRTAAQELFDLMFADVDINLRELGIGDLSVGKYVKRFARQFYAHAAALEAALEVAARGGARTTLTAFLARNVYRGGPAPHEAVLDALIDYLFGLARGLEEVPGDALVRGTVDLHSLVPRPYGETAVAPAAAGKGIDRPPGSD